MKNIIFYPYQDIPEEAEMLEVAPNIYWIRLPLPLKLDHVNVYVLDDGEIERGALSRCSKEISKGSSLKLQKSLALHYL